MGNSKLFFGRLTILIALLVILEIVMRLMNYRPGDMKPNWLNFQPVDSLVEYNPFFVNEKGIVVANKTDSDMPGMYINKHGFRTKEFETIDHQKKKLLLLGDSFTWGISAQPIDSSYANIIQNESIYEVINTGISGTDPYQYEGIAKWLIPEIKPHIVMLFFFTGNDLIKKYRNLIPCKPIYFYTNAGAIDVEIDDIYFTSADEAYNYITNEKYYIGNPKNIFERAVSKSVILSRLYSVKFRLKEKLEYENRLNNLSLTTDVLNNIKKICEENNSQLILIAIPEIKEADMTVEHYKEKYKSLFYENKIKNYWAMPQCEKKWFNDYPDAHLNNRGHRKYADYIMKILKENESKN